MLAAVLVTACGRSSPPATTAPLTTGGEDTSEGGYEVHTRNRRSSPFVITLVGVGQGDCIHVECGSGYDILIDCGSTGGGDREATATELDRLIGPDDDTVEMVVVTHGDADHFNYIAPLASGARSVLGDRRVETVLLGGHPEHYGSQVGQRLVERIRQISPNDPVCLTPNDPSPEDAPDPRFQCGDAAVYILAASITGRASTDGHVKNTDSIVLLFDHPERWVMLTGDATHETEESILERYSGEFLDVDVAKVPHHGALTSTVHPNDPEWPWLPTLRPETALISVGHHEGHQHPRCAVIEGLEATPTLRQVEPFEIECSDGQTWQTRTVTRDIRLAPTTVGNSGQ